MRAVALELAGYGLIVVGAAMVWLPLGVIAAGVVLINLAVK